MQEIEQSTVKLGRGRPFKALTVPQFGYNTKFGNFT